MGGDARGWRSIASDQTVTTWCVWRRISAGAGVDGITANGGIRRKENRLCIARAWLSAESGDHSFSLFSRRLHLVMAVALPWFALLFHRRTLAVR